MTNGSEVFPGVEWQARTPESAGVDRRGLDEFAGQLAGRGCVVRGGCMVYTWGDVAKRADIASASKPVVTHFLLTAVESGRIGSVDDRVAEVEPRLSEINAGLGHKDRAITWRHMANQASGYGVAEPPGTAFDYNDWQIALLWDCLFLKVYGATFETVDEAVLRPILTEPLGCEDAPMMLAFGLQDRPGRLAISVRDFARFGLLYLRQGQWRGRQLIWREHARMAVSNPLPASFPRTKAVPAEMIAGQRSKGSTRVPDDQTDHFGSYSWLWWTNGVDRHGVRMWPAMPPDAYCASGHGGKRGLLVIPSLDLVVSWNDAAIAEHTNGPDSPMNRALERLMAAVRER